MVDLMKQQDSKKMSVLEYSQMGDNPVIQEMIGKIMQGEELAESIPELQRVES